jgi:hypothetical protein
MLFAMAVCLTLKVSPARAMRAVKGSPSRAPAEWSRTTVT